MNLIIKNIRNVVIPTGLAFITVDGYLMQLKQSRITEEEVVKAKESISELQKQILNAQIENVEVQTRIEARVGRLTEHHNDMLKWLKKIEEVKNDTSSKGISDREYYTNEFKKAFGNSNKETENIVTDLKGGDSGLDKADLSGPIKDFIESYQNFINSLSLDQIVAVFNVLMIGSILLTMFSMSLLLVGDYLIDKFKLETR